MPPKLVHVDPVPQAVDPKEYKIPLILVAIGIAVYLVYALVVAGLPGLQMMAFYLPIRLAIQVVLGVVACLLTAKIMGISFGYAGSAICKLAAVFVFPSAVTIFIPWVGWIISLLLYWGLLEWLFELETMETIVLVIVTFLVNAGAILLLAFIGMAMH